MAAAATLPSVAANVRQTIDTLFDFIEAQGGSDYIGEQVSQLQHSLQAATLAQNAGADEETVIGALLHDVGRFIPAADKMPSMIAPDGTYVGKASHEIIGEMYLRQIGFSEKVCQLVGAHVSAKRYLTAVDQAYYDGLSKSSKATLEFQGGPFTAEQIKQAQMDPLLSAKLAVRRWDDQAKDGDMRTPPLSRFKDAATSCLLGSRSEFKLHGKRFNLPTKPVVVICVDGFDPEYLSSAIADDIVPHVSSIVKTGFNTTARCAMPSLTNPNNVSIITGQAVAVHGIVGNYFLDRKTGEEEMITDDSLLRGSTILAELSKRGVRVAALTAKDKLRAIISHGLSVDKGDICFSAEEVAHCTLEGNGIEDVEAWIGRPQPSQYSADLSLYVLDAGIKLLEEDRVDVFYLTLPDYVQHLHAPREPESDAFFTALDERVGALMALGADIAITGDHGMSDKYDPQTGEPNVLFLEDALDERFGARTARVICPIADPYVKHHGALGSFVRVHVGPTNIQASDGSRHANGVRSVTPLDEILDFIRGQPFVELALTGAEAAARFELDAEREGDLVVVARKNAVIGSRAAEHDLSGLGRQKLRSHGGVSEQAVPLMMSRPLRPSKAGIEGEVEGRNWRNWDVFELVLNH